MPHGPSPRGLAPLRPQGVPSLVQPPQPPQPQPPHGQPPRPQPPHGPQQPATGLGALSMLSPQTLQLLHQHLAMPPEMPPRPRRKS